MLLLVYVLRYALGLACGCAPGERRIALALGRRDEAISVWPDAVRRNPRLALVNNELAGVKESLRKLEEASSHEKQADQFTPSDPLLHWMIRQRLRDLGISDLAEKHLQQAGRLEAAKEVPGEH